MATFLQTVQRVMRTINRPVTETDVLQGAKDAINDAVKELQRDHAYSYTESMAEVVYPAGELFVDLGTVCDGLVRDYLSVQEVSAAGIVQGKPLKIVRYDQLQADRMDYDRRHSPDQTIAYSHNEIGMTIEDGYRQDKIAFIAGQHLGLYPTPANAVTLLVHLHIWIPEMDADGDENFFLDYAQDVVVLKALQHMSIFMKADPRVMVPEKLVMDKVASLIAWDGQLRQTPITTIR